MHQIYIGFRKSRTRTTTRSQLDVAFERISEQNFSTVINIEPVIPDAVVGRLSRLIKNNLKAPSDFRVHQDTENLPEVAEFRCRKYSANASIPVDSSSVQQTKPVFGVIEAPTARTSKCNLGSKTTLDKYFRAVKTSLRLRDLNPGKLSVAVSDVSVKIPDKRPFYSPAVQQRTDIKDDKLLFTKHFLNREYCVLYFIHPSISKN